MMTIKPTAAPFTGYMETSNQLYWIGQYSIFKHGSKPNARSMDKSVIKHVEGVATEKGITLDQLEAKSLKQYMLRVDTEFYNECSYQDVENNPIVSDEFIATTTILQYTLIEEDTGVRPVIAVYKPITQVVTHALGHMTQLSVKHSITPIAKNATMLYNLARALKK